MTLYIVFPLIIVLGQQLIGQILMHTIFGNDCNNLQALSQTQLRAEINRFWL